MRTGLLTAAAFAAVAFSGIAEASVITETFTGVLNSGIDNAGTFGAVGASFAGDTVTFSFSYDTGLLEADVIAGANGSAQYLEPDYDKNHDLPGDSAFTERVNINSQTHTTTSNSGLGYLEACTAANCGGADGQFVTVAQLGGGASIETNIDTTQNYSTGDDLLSQTDVDALVGGGVTTGVIYISDGAPVETLGVSNVSAESATPEPTTWISLALGFGMVGGLKRRRSAR